MVDEVQQALAELRTRQPGERDGPAAPLGLARFAAFGAGVGPVGAGVSADL